MPVLAGINCVGYGRVSTERQAGETQTSLSDQRVAIEAHAETLGVTVGAWYWDEGISGATAEQRPALLRLIDDCKESPRTAAKPGLVLVLNDSRWGRFPDSEEASYWRTHLKKYSGWIVRFAEGDDMGDNIGRKVMRLVSADLASEYRVAIKRNAKRGSRGTAEQGYWGTAAPYGYRRKVVYPAGRERVLVGGQRKATDEKVALTPDETESAVVRELFERYATGVETLATLTQWLLDTQPTRKWSRQAVRATMLNPAYLGDVVSGRVPADKHEKALAARCPEADWVVCRDAHPAIVSRELFASVQEVMTRNSHWTNRVRADWLVSGLVSCRCGRTLVAGGGTKVSPFYRCGSKVLVQSDRCAYPGGVKKEWLERAVLKTVADIVGARTHRDRLLAHLDHALLEVRRAPEDASAQLDGQIREASVVRDRLVAAVADGTLTGDEAKSKLTAARRQIARLESQRDTLSHDVASQGVLDTERDQLAALTLDFRAAVKGLHGPDLRELIRPWVANAVFDTGNRTLTIDIRHVPDISSGHLVRMGWQRCQTHAGVTRRRVVVGAR